MKPRNIFQLELAELFAHKRSLYMKFGITLLLALPFVFTAMPLRVKVTGIVVLLLFTSFFGSAVALVRRHTTGQLERLRILPYSRASIFADFLLSGTLIDVLQMLLPILLLVSIHIHGTVSAYDVSFFLGMFVVSAFFFNLLGLLLGFAVRSNAEVHLSGSLGIGLILFLSGFIPVPSRLQGFIQALSSWSPAAQLVNSMLNLINGKHVIQPTLSLVMFGCLGLVFILWASRTFNWRGLLHR